MNTTLYTYRNVVAYGCEHVYRKYYYNILQHCTISKEYIYVKGAIEIRYINRISLVLPPFTFPTIHKI